MCPCKICIAHRMPISHDFCINTRTLEMPVVTDKYESASAGGLSAIKLKLRLPMTTTNCNRLNYNRLVKICAGSQSR